MVAEAFQAIRGRARVGDLDGLVGVLGAHRLHHALTHLDILDAAGPTTAAGLGQIPVAV
jgi:hypothetical protein